MTPLWETVIAHWMCCSITYEIRTCRRFSQDWPIDRSPIIVHSVSQRPSLRHLCEPLGGTEGLIKTMAFKKTTECVWRRTNVNARRDWVPDWGAATLNNHTMQRSCGPEEPTDLYWSSVEMCRNVVTTKGLEESGPSWGCYKWRVHGLNLICLFTAWADGQKSHGESTAALTLSSLHPSQWQVSAQKMFHKKEAWHLRIQSGDWPSDKLNWNCTPRQPGMPLVSMAIWLKVVFAAGWHRWKHTKDVNNIKPVEHCHWRPAIHRGNNQLLDRRWSSLEANR